EPPPAGGQRPPPRSNVERMDGDDEDDAAGPDLSGLAADEGWELPPESRAVLVESLASDDAAVRLEAVEMLAHSLGGELARRARALARTAPDEEVRVAAVLALGPGLGASEGAVGNEPASGEPDGLGPPLSATAVEAVSQGLRQIYFDSAAP